MQNNPNNKKSIIKKIIVTFIVLAIIAGGITGGVIYLKNNKDKIEWNLITFPWEKKGFMWPWEQGNYTEEERIEKEIEEETVVISGLKKPTLEEPLTYDTNLGNITIDSIELTKKGYEIDITYNMNERSRYEPISIDLNKILVDGLDFELDKVTINKSSNQIIEITRPKFELYNKDGFKRLNIAYSERNTNNEESVGNLEISIPNRTSPTTKLGKRINIDKRETVNGKIELYYWKKVEDSDNTYLYFYAVNGLGKKTISVKKLLINDKLYDYKELKEELYPNSEKGFSIKIPKKDVKKIKKIEGAFFITTEEKDKYGKGIYLTNEYSLTIKD